MAFETPTIAGPQINTSESDKLAYPPNFLPGARTINTPFGSTHVFEFGPETGQKVLLVHGISTPCISIAGLARDLAERGCRVMTFDLYGRGFSSTPAYLPHNSSLYNTQILSVLASSSLPWTGDNAFCLIGYSLGGGISANFASMFPSVVKALVLIAPAGLIREHHNAGTKRLFALTSGWMPEGAWRWVLNRRVGTTAMSLPEALGSGGNPEDGPTEDEDDIITGPLNDDTVKEVIKSIKWQVDNNLGFIRSFMSSAQFGPTSGEHEAWRKIGARLNMQREEPDSAESQRLGLVGGKVLVLMGNKDAIILRSEVEPDIKETLGRQNVKMVIFEAGHDLPVQMSEKVTEKIWESWKAFGTVS